MRPLTEPETRTVLNKLANYAGPSLKDLFAPLDKSEKPDHHVLRLSRSRVYYVRLSLANLATSVARDKLLSCGTCLGRFTKSGKFHLHITSLPILAPIARYKIWLRPNGVMPFLYGGNIVKAHVGRWSQDCPEHLGVVIYTMDDIPLGFGVTAKSASAAQQLGPTGIVCFRQADCGEFLRDEDTLFTTG
ncbi:60S ribosome subunit biogenesis protein NIP7 [Ophiocordyceps camponoti-floridani]|uniref:60S ribosome subunit biogenesis protein NIP7 n=1 Tax=Ophiocordyceps camponoti-floridani TaxID=2030778 RepID=A0A8H4VBK4_9HYPO|nr:60S ribosome subunit biogenesis protein NIP7 [Ophiocordyceps camponoti-floridani]